MEDQLLIFGGAVKALSGGRVGGYLVKFGTPDEIDVDGEFFSADTDYDVDFPGKATVYYNHGLDPVIGKRKLGKGEMKADEVGIWIEAQLDQRDRYEKAIYELAKAGKLGWSSGSAPHLVEKAPAGKAMWLKSWPIIDASLTPKPANPRSAAMTLKSCQEETPSLEEAIQQILSEKPNEQTEGEPVTDLPLKQHSEAVVSACEETAQALATYVARLEGRQEARIKVGRMLSQANVEELQSVSALRGDMNAMFDRLDSLITKAQPEPEATEEPVAADPGSEDASEEAEALCAYLDFQNTVSRLNETLSAGLTV